MGDYIAIAVIVVILAAAITYIIRAKKNGAKCIGCPHGKSCGSCNCGCSNNKQKDSVK